MLRIRVATAVVVALGALAPAAALAHKGDPNYQSVIRSMSPRADGVQLSVVNRDDRFLLVNGSDETVLVRGYGAEPEPYARIRPDGLVQVNLNSTAAYINEERDGVVDVPDEVDPSAAPRWRTVSRSGRFEWHDHRMHWMAEGRPEAVTDPGRRTKVFDYTVPIEVGERPGAITGTLFWTPTPGGDAPLAAIAGFVALGLVGSVAAVVVRRRRGRRGEEPAEAW